MMDKRLCVLNVVGLTRELLRHAPRIASLGTPVSWASPVPAVTCTSQATMLTGKPPRDHGIVGNGWLYRDTQEVRFWQQSRTLIESEVFYDRYETAKMFWWFNQSTSARYGATPKPHYGCDGSKVFDVLDWTGCDLTRHLGPFPFFAFWGPAAGIASSDWIADATALVMRQKRPQLTLCYLPHLDYDFQRLPVQDPARVAEVDAAAGRVIDAAREIDAEVIAVSEYGLTAVDRAVPINRVLRREGHLQVRLGPFGEVLMPGESDAFAVADHQVAHVYVRRPESIPAVKRLLESTEGIAAVVPPGDLQLDHPRSGELIALAEPNAWFSYYYWLDDDLAPDFARTVDIHRKPGYDPCELFMTSRLRAGGRLMQKKLGFRYKMDVIPLNPSLVRGSHGLSAAEPDSGPVIVGPETPPTDMRGFPEYVRSILMAVLIVFGWFGLAEAYPPAGDSGPPAPEVTDPSRLTLPRIYQGGEFGLDSKPLRWDDAEDALWWKRKSENEDEAGGGGGAGSELVKIAVPDGDETVVLDARSLRIPVTAADRSETGATEPGSSAPEPAEPEQPGVDRPSNIEDYAWSDDKRFLLAYVNSVRVWRANTRGDYWVLDREENRWRRLGPDSQENSTLMFATFSPDNRRVAYVRDRGLYAEDLETGTIRTIAASENGDLIHGTFDWVYEEELGLRRGFRFSPDGSKIAFWQLDESDVPRHTLIDETSERYPAVKQYAYPKVGQTNSAARIGVFDFATGQTTWMQIPGDPRQHYLAAIRWLGEGAPPESVPAAAANRLLIQQLNRRQNENRLWLADASTGMAEKLLTETGPEIRTGTETEIKTGTGWVMHQAELHRLPSVKSEPRIAPESIDFVWLSERTGWQHLYRLSIDLSEETGESGSAATLTPLTQGSWDVTQIDHVDSETGRVWFTSAMDSPITRAIYFCETIGSGRGSDGSENGNVGDGSRRDSDAVDSPQRVSPERDGTFSYSISPSGRYALETWSSFGTPPVKRLVRLSPYEVIETINDNAKAKSAIEALAPIDQRFVKLQIDERTSLDAYLMTPGESVRGEDADGTAGAGGAVGIEGGVGSPAKWPLLVYVYGEPAGQTVRDVYGGSSYLWHRYMVQSGFAVASIDNRGTASPRGVEFRQAIYGKIGVLSAQDQAAGVRQLLERFPQIDPNAVGVWGWSGGGSSTLNCLFRYPELFAAGVSIAPVADQRDYDTIYQERYMGLIEDGEQRFLDGSPITHVDGLQDPVLIIHGSGDDNVHFASTQRLINELVAKDKTFRMLVYPGRSHSISEGRGTVMHLRRTMTEFLIEHLRPGG